MKYSAPKGTFDIIPGKYLEKEVWKAAGVWQFIEQIAREVAGCFGFEEIRTPLFESTDLFRRSSGETSDIVTKEMYTFEDKGGRSMTLRPEGTAPVLRAAIERGIVQKGGNPKLYYLSPMFRYERPQAGRFRQHHQFGVEAIGFSGVELDVEVIDLLLQFYERLGLKDLTLHLNSLGDPESRALFRKALVNYLKKHEKNLSEESQSRLVSNPMRILDSKDAADQAILQEAPQILDTLTDGAKKRFDKVQELLKALEIPFQVNPRLVRGLDYYNHTVFEVTCDILGAQNSIGGGGRYDGLIANLGGPDLPGIGFGCGLERVIQTMLAQKEGYLSKPFSSDIFFVPLDEEASRACLQLCHELRKGGVSCELGDWTAKLKKTMTKAYDSQTKTITVIGSQELQQNTCELIRTASKEKEVVDLSAKTFIHILKSGA